MEPVRVLIVDEMEGYRDHLRAVFEARPDRFEVVGEASDAQEAFEAVRGTDPDLVVFDAMVRGQAGPRLVPRLRRVVPYARFVALLPYWDDAMVDRMRRTGADAVAPKSLDDARLHGLLEDVMEKREGTIVAS